MIRSFVTVIPSAQSRASSFPTAASATALAASRMVGREGGVVISLSHNGKRSFSSTLVPSMMLRTSCSRPNTTMSALGVTAPPSPRLQSLSSPLSCPPYNTYNGRRFYTPMTPEEEEKEKARVLYLSPEEKDQELRKLNREISKLEKLKGINTGELYTWSGRYKSLLRDYGLPLFAYYWVCYGTMAVGVYTCITVGGLDAMEVIARFDNLTGFSMAEKVDPELGKIGLTLVLNEVLEPIRLPFVVATLKPILDVVSPPKY